MKLAMEKAALDKATLARRRPGFHGHGSGLQLVLRRGAAAMEMKA